MTPRSYRHHDQHQFRDRAGHRRTAGRRWERRRHSRSGRALGRGSGIKCRGGRRDVRSGWPWMSRTRCGSRKRWPRSANVSVHPTVLVNNAGIEGFDQFLDITTEMWNRMIAVNLTGTFNCCQAVVPDMMAGLGPDREHLVVERPGRQPRMTHYVASKAGVMGLPRHSRWSSALRGSPSTPSRPASSRRRCCGRPRRRDCSQGVNYHAAQPGAAGGPRTSPPPARSWCATRPATSPDRSSVSTADGTPDGTDPTAAAAGVAPGDA